MNKEELVDYLRDDVAPGLLVSACRATESPSGRVVSPEQRALSAWCKGLGPEERTHFEAALKRAVDLSLFSFLCMLDGVADSPASLKGGKLKLVYVAEDGAEAVVSDPDVGEYLHEMFNGA